MNLSIVFSNHKKNLHFGESFNWVEVLNGMCINIEFDKKKKMSFMRMIDLCMRVYQV